MAFWSSGIGRHDIFFKMGFAFLTLAFCCADSLEHALKHSISRSQSGNAVRVKGFGVQSLETLHFLRNLVLRGWKRCTCQRIWCSVSRNVAPVSGFCSEFGTLRLSADFVLRLWKHCPCQQIWRSESGNAARVSGFAVQFRVWKRCIS